MSKITNDPIHGIIILHPIIVKIIDTPQFQRLRNIKQLGGCYFVYPGAPHNRFEHSIGVYHLASKLASQLKEKIEKDIKDLPEIADRLKKAQMTNNEKLCIEIAALCHDLGHGPFSHLFDRMFNKEIEKKTGDTWTHEELSKKMIDYMLEENKDVKDDLRNCFETEKEYEEGIRFIKDLIDVKNRKEGKVWKQYMYQIVANNETEIDVDKMDYFVRDCHGLGMKSNFDHNRYISQCRVMFIDGKQDETTIAVRDKEVFNLYELFHTRIGLFRRAYYHRVTKAIELMITDALVKADDSVKIYYSNGIAGNEAVREHKKMSKAWECMAAYEKLTDGIIDHILILGDEGDEGLKKAKDIIKRIYTRKLYRLAQETIPNKKIDEKKIIQLETDLKDDGFKVQKITYNYGKKEENPIESVYFYGKDNTKTCSKLGKTPDKVSLFLPSNCFQEEIIRIYSTESDDESYKRLKEKAEECLDKIGLEYEKDTSDKSKPSTSGSPSDKKKRKSSK